MNRLLMTDRDSRERILPPGWKWTPLDDVCLGIQTIDPKKTPDLEFSYIDISSIDRGNQSDQFHIRPVGERCPKQGKASRTRRRRSGSHYKT